MICSECGHIESKVVDSRPTDSKIRRRRECLSCGYRFTTYELVEDMPLMVAKKDGTIEPFDNRKLIERILRATVKRPVKLRTVENMVDGIQNHFKNTLQKEVNSYKIGEIVLQRLRDIDHVAYIRFASVYREFEDADGFVRIISELQSKQQDENDIQEWEDINNIENIKNIKSIKTRRNIKK